MNEYALKSKLHNVTGVLICQEWVRNDANTVFIYRRRWFDNGILESERFGKSGYDSDTYHRTNGPAVRQWDDTGSLFLEEWWEDGDLVAIRRWNQNGKLEDERWWGRVQPLILN